MVRQTSPQSSNELILIRKFKEFLKEFSPASHLLQTHAMEDTKIVECLTHSEITI